MVEEKIDSYTNADVKKVEVLDTKRDGSSVTVRERVAVAVTPLVKVLQDNAVPTVAFDTDSAAGTVDSLARQKQAAMDMYADLLTRTASLVSVGVVKPEVDPSLPSGPDQSWLSIPVTFRVNREARREWRSKFEHFAKERAEIEVPVKSDHQVAYDRPYRPRDLVAGALAGCHVSAWSFPWCRVADRPPRILLNIMSLALQRRSPTLRQARFKSVKQALRASSGCRFRAVETPRRTCAARCVETSRMPH